MMTVAALTSILCLAAEVQLGQPFQPEKPLSVAQVNRDAAKLVGQTVQVRGRVTEVCQMMGCWMNLVDPNTGDTLRIKVNDGDIVFPKNAPGKQAIAEGTLKKLVLSKEQAAAMAKHEAEEQGRKFDPASVKSGKTVYQIQGTGAIVLD
jgi:NMD protein affecting ribosome stability and mRNA decay